MPPIARVTTTLPLRVALPASPEDNQRRSPNRRRNRHTPASPHAGSRDRAPPRAPQERTARHTRARSHARGADQQPCKNAIARPPGSVEADELDEGRGDLCGGCGPQSRHRPRAGDRELPKIVDCAQRRLRLAVEPHDPENVPPIALDLVNAICIGMDQRERADRIVEQKPRLGLEDPRPHQRARIGAHVGLLERVQDFLKAPHDAGVRGDERAPIRIEHAPHRASRNSRSRSGARADIRQWSDPAVRGRRGGARRCGIR